jgi:phosphatidylglycerophosphate synthase
VITTAYLVGAGAPATAIVAGVPVLLRQALSLQAAGIELLVLVGVADRNVLNDSRLRLLIRETDAASIDAHDAAIVSAVGCVWPQPLVKRLVEIPISDDEIRTAGHEEASLYICGAARLLPLMVSLSNHDLIPRPFDGLRVVPSNVEGRQARDERVIQDERTPQAVTLAPREFVVLPRSPREIDAAVALLLKSLYKPTDGLIARTIDRHVSLAITRQLLSTRITPNQMTALATIVGAIGVWILARGGYWNVLAGAALFEAQGILDGCDGEIARIKYLHSRAGEWFDQVADDVLNVALLAAVGAVLAADGYRYAWPLTRISIVCQIVFAVALYAGLIKTGGGGSVARLRWWVDRPGISTVGDLTRRDFMSFFYLVSAVVGWVHAAFVWHAVVTIGSCIVTSIQWLFWGGPELQSQHR